MLTHLFSDSRLQLFRHQIAIRVLDQLTGFDPLHPGRNDNVKTYLENSKVGLARLDAFIAIIVICLQ